jgi:DMSO/TMAO reductase YedYZ molybdopterin-dependent catalytic subunit
MMTRRVARLSRLFVAVTFWTAACAGSLAAHPQSSQAAVALTVTGAVEKPLSLSLADLRQLPRSTAKVVNSQSHEEQTYEGVSLAELLKQAGVPQGSKLRGAALATYLEATGADGYTVVFSLEETDPSIQDPDILVADGLNGKPLDNKAGPLRLVVPRDKRGARWVRMLTSIKVMRASN